MAVDPDRPARRATFVLMAIAYASCEVAAYPDGVPRPFGVAFGLVLFALAIVASYFVPRPRPGQAFPRAAMAVLAACLGTPVLVEPALRAITGNGLPLELQMVNGLRNAGLALAALAAWPRARKLAGVVALFLALFASAMGDQPAIPYLLAAFAVIGGVWLVLNYWADRIEVPVGSTAAIDERVWLRVPIWELGFVGFLLAAAVLVAVLGPRTVSAHLGELLPTSGGTGDYDPFSRGGVNDGPEEMAGDNATTAGMVDSDKMIESQQDSLIDAVSDTYGPPHKPRKNQERMVAAGFAEVRQSHDTAENKRPSRDFDTGRKGPSSARKAEGREARALFEVEGRTPIHVRAAAFDLYDSAGGYWHEAAKPHARLLEAVGNDWMEIRGKTKPAWYAADDRHVLKVADLPENLVPTPSLTARVRIRRVDKEHYYDWDYDGVLALAGRKKTPSGTVVYADSRTVDPSAMPADGFARGDSATRVGAVPPDLDAPLRCLAREWAGDRPRGWRQIEAVLERLRADFVLDPTAVAPKDHPAPVLWFLTESHRGPDYLFATSATLLLRSLGYSTRFCVGFYANPEAFDPISRHTPVRATDLHAWPEVLLTDSNWLPIEPTPGYSVLPPLAPWQDQLAAAGLAVLDWVERRMWILAASVVALSLAVWYRRRLQDAAFTLAWRLRPGRTWETAALRTLRLLERRAVLAGVGRSDSETLRDWARRVASDESLEAAVGWAERAAYAPNLAPPGDLPVEFRDAVRAWPLARFQKLTGEAR